MVALQHESKRTTILSEDARPRPNLMCRGLASPVPTHGIFGDITYLRTGRGQPYLSPVMDPDAHIVVSWSLSDWVNTDIVPSALANAKAHGYVAVNEIIHADKGARHASRLLAEWTHDNDVRLSCDRTSGCHDDAVEKSFFATPKDERDYRRSLAAKVSAKHAMIDLV